MSLAEKGANQDFRRKKRFSVSAEIYGQNQCT
jgi:hypothetical protein